MVDFAAAAQALAESVSALPRREIGTNIVAGVMLLCDLPEADDPLRCDAVFSAVRDAAFDGWRGAQAASPAPTRWPLAGMSDALALAFEAGRRIAALQGWGGVAGEA